LRVKLAAGMTSRPARPSASHPNMGVATFAQCAARPVRVCMYVCVCVHKCVELYVCAYVCVCSCVQEKET
jgi:hypothetical protein